MFDANGFQAPFVIQRIEGHGIKVPKKKDFTLEKVIEILGEQFRIPVMDCETQVKNYFISFYFILFYFHLFEILFNFLLVLIYFESILANST